MKERFSQLRNALPSVHPDDTDRKVITKAVNYINYLKSQIPNQASTSKETLIAPPPFEAVFLEEDELADQHFFEEEPLSNIWKNLFLLDEDQDE